MNTTKNWSIVGIIILAAFIAMEFFSNKNATNFSNKNVNFDLAKIQKRGTLKAIVTYNSVSYFIYRGQVLGLEYEYLQDYAKSINVKLEMVVAKDDAEMQQLLHTGKGDIIANALFKDTTLQNIAYTNSFRNVEQVLVQRKPNINLKNDTTKVLKNIKSPYDLDKIPIYITSNSTSFFYLKSLADTLGINIDARIIADNRSTEDLIESVSKGEIDYTIANKDLAMVNQTYFENLDINLIIGKKQNLYWATRDNSTNLTNSINNWLVNFLKSKNYAAINTKYFSENKSYFNNYDDVNSMYQAGAISQYDVIIQKYAKGLDWDWRLIAALIWQESKFNRFAKSWVGASGLMQLMPATGREYGCVPSNASNPEINIKAGTAFIKSLNTTWSDIEDYNQRIKFILASYNAGAGHVKDAQRLAKKYGYPADKWDGSVEYFILYKSNPKFYNDKVVKYGYCRGKEPFDYVRKIVKKYLFYQNNIQLTAETAPKNPLFKLYESNAEEFAGIDGMYNPAEALKVKNATQEMFKSRKLFETNNELIPRDERENPFTKKEVELFVKRELKEKTARLFEEGENILPEQPNTNGGLIPKDNSKINQLQPRKK